VKRLAALSTALFAVTCAMGCAAPAHERCPDCSVVDAHHSRLPRLKSGTRRLFVLVPGLLGYGWEWTDPVKRLRATPDADFIVFSWDPWASLDRSARQLRSVVSDVLDEAPPSLGEVIVVAHSAAGLVAARAVSGLPPPARKLLLVTIGAPFAGMHICPWSEADVVHAPLMLAIAAWFREWGALPAGVEMLEYVTSYPSDPVMHPYSYPSAAPPGYGPPGATRIEVDARLDHNHVVDKVVGDLLNRK
jgi:pimeloyl-ACP methyl ester carboxylesterase